MASGWFLTAFFMSWPSRTPVPIAAKNQADIAVLSQSYQVTLSTLARRFGGFPLSVLRHLLRANEEPASCERGLFLFSA